jgi:hypothetical protein
VAKLAKDADVTKLELTANEEDVAINAVVAKDAEVAKLEFNANEEDVAMDAVAAKDAEVALATLLTTRLNEVPSAWFRVMVALLMLPVVTKLPVSSPKTCWAIRVYEAVVAF